MVRPRPPKVEMDFTEAQLTSFGGWSVLGQMAERFGLTRRRLPRIAGHVADRPVPVETSRPGAASAAAE